MTLFGLVFIDLHLFLSVRTSRRHFHRALANSMMVSKRASVKGRMEKFVKRANRVMIASLVFTTFLVMLTIVFAACRECWGPALFCFIPLLTLICGGWIIRAMIVSIQASSRNRWPVKSVEHAVSAHASNSSLGSKHAPDAGTDSHHLPVSSSKQQKEHASNSSSGGKKRTKKVTKKMTVVQEADYEGTVIITQIESGTDIVRYPRLARINKEETVEEEEVSHDNSKGTSS